jgi:hypothetical protein
VKVCLLLFAVAAFVAGCATTPTPFPQPTVAFVAPSASALPSPSLATLPPPAVPTPPPPPPVDTSIPAVSASNPSPRARSALEACGAYDLGLDHVAGMGELARGTDAPRFGLSALAPEVHTSAPVWLIQFRGEVPQLMAGQSWTDPICMVSNGKPSFFATGPIRDLGSGMIVRGYWPLRGVASLPPLSP